MCLRTTLYILRATDMKRLADIVMNNPSITSLVSGTDHFVPHTLSLNYPTRKNIEQRKLQNLLYPSNIPYLSVY